MINLTVVEPVTDPVTAPKISQCLASLDHFVGFGFSNAFYHRKIQAILSVTCISQFPQSVQDASRLHFDFLDVVTTMLSRRAKLDR